MDLHAFVDLSDSTIEFRVIRHGRLVQVEVPRETVNQRFGVRVTSPHDLLTAYEAHRSEIDAAVIRKAAGGGGGVVMVRPRDI
jgi:hypothetical protein